MAEGERKKPSGGGKRDPRVAPEKITSSGRLLEKRRPHKDRFFSWSAAGLRPQCLGALLDRWPKSCRQVENPSGNLRDTGTGKAKGETASKSPGGSPASRWEIQVAGSVQSVFLGSAALVQEEGGMHTGHLLPPTTGQHRQQRSEVKTQGGYLSLFTRIASNAQEETLKKPLEHNETRCFVYVRSAGGGNEKRIRM